MKVGFTCSTFDLLHAGHLIMLREAKEQCDYLICGLQVDPNVDRAEKNVPVQTVVERYTQLKGVEYVDEIVPYGTEEDLEDIMQKIAKEQHDLRNWISYLVSILKFGYVDSIKR